MKKFIILLLVTNQFSSAQDDLYTIDNCQTFQDIFYNGELNDIQALSDELLIQYYESGTTFLVDFENLRICKLNVLQTSELLTGHQYLRINSKISKNKLFIEIGINWEKYHFVLDLSFDGMLKIPVKRNPFQSQHLNRRDTSKEFHYDRKKILFGGVLYSSEILIAQRSKFTVGINFIRSFNWIIDPRQKRIYVKKNSIQLN